MATAPQMTARTKHINQKYHFFREHIGADKGIELKHVASSYNIGDLFTKGLPYDSFTHLHDLLMGWNEHETMASLTVDLEPFDQEGVLQNDDPPSAGPTVDRTVSCNVNCSITEPKFGS